MKYIGFTLLIVTAAVLCIWQQTLAVKPSNARPDLKWKAAYLTQLPKGIDTNVIVKDLHGTSLRFSQYVKLLFNNEAIIYQNRGQWTLHRTNKAAYDSLSRDDFAVARVKRAQAYLAPDTVSNWKVKLNQIANTLAKADYVLVLKSKRKIWLKRKGVDLLSFNLNMGWAPVGKKEVDGDGKTPEGLYYLDNKYNRNDKFYKSIWISYPNAEDRLAAKAKGLKPGVGIMIHGTTPAKRKAKDWTAGCIALQNNDMDALFAHVEEGTPIEIRK